MNLIRGEEGGGGMSVSGPSDGFEMSSRGPLYKRPWFPYAIFLILLALLALTSLSNFLLFHSLAEVFGVAASLTIAAVVLNSRGTIENNYLRILGVSYMFTAAIEALHLLAYEGMGVFPYNADLATQLWLAFRYVQAGTLIIAPLAIGRKISWGAIIAGYFVITLAVLASVFMGFFPSAYLEPVGLTPFKIYSEYVIIGLAALGGALLFLRRQWFDRPIHRLLMLAVAMFILAELTFTLYVSVTSLINMLGHLFLLAEFFLVFMAIVRTGIAEPTRLLYRELHDREVMFRSMVENVRDVLFRLELVPQLKLEYVSPVVQDILGYSPEELYRDPRKPSFYAAPVTKPIVDIIVNDEPDRSLHTIQAIRRDGKTIWLQVSTVIARDENGRPVMIAGIARDVSETVQTLEQLRRAQYKLQLLGSLSNHDLRNHITTAAGYLQLAERTVDDGKMADYLAKARASMKDMNALLDSTKRYYELGEVPPAWLDLGEVVHKALASLDMYGLEVQVEIPGVEVYADEMLVQVFNNLIHNTIRHGLGATIVRISGKKADEGLLITYEDNGPGVAANEKEAIFEWNYASRRGHGLHYVSEILASTGMSIRETGTEGKGAIFEIQVPRGGYRFIDEQPGAVS